MARTVQVAIDCADPGRLAHFWCEALGYILDAPPEGFPDWPSALASWGVPESQWNDVSAIVDPDGLGPRIYLQKVPESKTVKNRLHLDVRTSERGTPLGERRTLVAAEVERLTAAGATELRHTEDDTECFTVMQDPEGNEFCVT